MLVIDHLIRDHAEAFPLSNKCFQSVFPPLLDAVLRQQALIFVG